MAGAYQYQWVDGDDNKGCGAVPFQPEFSFRPTGKDEIVAGFGFAAGNGLNGVSDFNLAPWAADLEDDVKDINGRNRDYSQVAEVYWRVAFNDYFAATADVQYMKDKSDVSGMDDLEGIIAGIRMTTKF